MAHEFDYMSATELRLRIARKDISPVELARHTLERADAVQADLNPFFVMFPDHAMSAAQAAEDAVMSGGALGALHGLPISVKDLISVCDAPFAFGSKVMANNIAPDDAPAVERARAAGAVVIGKTTTSEFGCKPVGDSPLTGVTRNPWHRRRRFDSNTELAHRTRWDQGQLRSGASLAHHGDSHARPRRPHGTHPA